MCGLCPDSESLRANARLKSTKLSAALYTIYKADGTISSGYPKTLGDLFELTRTSSSFNLPPCLPSCVHIADPRQIAGTNRIEPVACRRRREAAPGGVRSPVRRLRLARAERQPVHPLRRRDIPAGAQPALCMSNSACVTQCGACP